MTTSVQTQVSPASKFAPAAVHSNLLQRKCACGGTPGFSGECEECRKKREGTLQRAAITGDLAGSSAPPIVHETLRSSGQPLDAGTRNFMETRFGHDFSQVRVHTDTRAAASAQAVNAHAYTVGQNIVFNNGQFSPALASGRRLLAHELTHVVQQSGQPGVMQTSLRVGSPDDSAERQADRTAESVVQGQPVSGIDAAPAGVVRREDFKPWPGQAGTNVPGTLSQKGAVTGEKIQRTDSPNYAPPKPIQLDFNSSTCTLTSSMEINFVKPTDKSAQLSDERFTKLKTRILEVANEKLNGWMKIQVGDNPSCDVCRGKTISINVVASEGSSPNASKVELRKGTGRANSGTIFEGGEDWLTSFLGGVSDGTLWHESGHIVLGLPDEYAAQPGDPPRPADKTNEGDWSVMASHPDFGRRAVLHPRHFSFMTVWLGSRFPDCKFDLVAEARPIVIDVVFGASTNYGTKGGALALLDTIDLAAGIPLDKKRNLRLLVGGYTSYLLSTDANSQSAFLAGALVGLDYSTNRSKGGFGISADVRGGGAYFTSGVPDAEKGKFLPSLSGSVTLGYAGPRGQVGLSGTTGKIFSESQKDSPFYMLGLKAAYTF